MNKEIESALNTIVRVADFSREGIHSLGPSFEGESRKPLWLQGCPLRCPKCISPEWRDFNGGVEYSVARLLPNLFPNLELTPYSGISMSGGEPLEQPQAVVDILKVLKYLKPTFHSIIFTGKELAEIQNIPQYNELAKVVNIMVTGPYIEGLNNGFGLRGSSNQTVFTSLAGKFIERNLLQPNEFEHPLDNWDYENGPRKIQFLSRWMNPKDSSIGFAGVPTPEMLETFNNIVANSFQNC